MPEIRRDILSRGKYLSLDEFTLVFDEEWEKMSRRFFKYESLQYYDEGSDSPYLAFIQKNYEKFARQLRAAQAADKPFFDAAKARGASFVRLHAVRVPLSEYLQFECYSYYLSEMQGEQIFFVEESGIMAQVGGGIGDFIIFDDVSVLAHDYDAQGVLRGGWFLNDRSHVSVISSLAENLLCSGCQCLGACSVPLFV